MKLKISMKKYLALMFILISSFGFSQTSIKDTKEVDYVDLSVNLIDDQKMDKDVKKFYSGWIKCPTH